LASKYNADPRQWLIALKELAHVVPEKHFLRYYSCPAVDKIEEKIICFVISLENAYDAETCFMDLIFFRHATVTSVKV